MATTPASDAATRRRRSSSIKQALNAVSLAGDTVPPVPDRTLPAPDPARRTLRTARPHSSTPTGFLHDLSSFKWMVNPETSLQLISMVLAAWAGLELTLPRGTANPLSPLVFVSYPLRPEAGEDEQRYGKGLKDLLFLGFYIVVFSFLRQSITEYLVRPVAKRLGVKGESKTQRFMEQAYGIIYWGSSGALGLYVMRRQDSWWYRTEHFWLEYPNHWRMTGVLKAYYLLQFAYWLQQMLVLILRLEKPRSDFNELVVHHCVTLWLVGWSYLFSLTSIGVAIFVSMDLPDVAFALSKCLNYLDLQHTSEASFVFFLGVWHYLRHYQNLRIIHSVWTEWDLIPSGYGSWAPGPGETNEWWLLAQTGARGGRLAGWMKWQVLAPIVLLQLVQAFWTALIWRVLYRMINGFPAKDSREEGEDDDDDGAGQPGEAKKEK